MPFNGSGVFQRLYSWIQDATNSIPISSTRMDADTNDIAAGLSNCVTRDGQGGPTANIPMGGYKFLNVANAALSNEWVTLGQSDGRYLQLSGSAAMTGTLSGTSATFTGTVTAQSAGAGGVAVYVGNDASLWDVNIANTLGVYGQSDNTVGGVKLGSNGPTLSGSSTQLLINSTVHANGQINSDSTMSCIQGLVTMENATGGLQGLLVTTSSSNAFNACYMAFNNTGKYAVYFGLGSDNTLRVGGWSMGATSQRILHEGLSNAVLPSLTLGGGRLLTKITLANTAPGTLANGELYLQY